MADDDDDDLSYDYDDRHDDCHWCGTCGGVDGSEGDPGHEDWWMRPQAPCHECQIEAAKRNEGKA